MSPTVGPAPFPMGACDSHIHVYDHRFPSAPTTVLEPPDATLDDYAADLAELGITRTVIVQPTTYGLDNRCQLDAVAVLGTEKARAVVVIDRTVSRAQLDELHERGARGARFHMLPGGSVGWDELGPVGERIADLGWHVQLQLDGRELPRHLPALAALPCDLVVDHIGRFMPPVPPDHPSFAALLGLVERGAWVKLSAPYESDPSAAPAFPAASELARRLVATRPDRMLWASNWPHPGQPAALEAPQLVDLLADWSPDAAVRRTILVDNPARLYGFGPVGGDQPAA